MKTNKKTFTIDCRKWVCGTPKMNSARPNNHLGEGGTLLLNSEGYSCCIGLISLQCGVPEEELMGLTHPVGNVFPDFLVNMDSDSEYLSQLTYGAAFINDSIHTSVAVKIVQLTKLFSKHGFSLKFTHIPKRAREELKAMKGENSNAN